MANKENPVMDYAEHYHTYDLFTGLVKYGAIASIVIVALMAIFLL
ncbi:aa3-type cytochrome c oxidase subunit IV [uncultured Cohaesibacter sp.]|nr:aa3-type cytochrome c oxidase subunit IV [uncultured Cohaesibacter sp.]